MKKSITLVLSLFVFIGNSSNNDFPSLKNSGVSFKENKGQICDQNFKPRPDVLFFGSDKNMAFHLRTNGISYQLSKIDYRKNKLMTDGLSDNKTKRQEKITMFRIDLNWLGSKKTKVIASDVLSGHDNYYFVNCPLGVTNVKTYTSITYKNLYEGIDLHYYNKDGQLKYDYIIQPKTDYKQIKIEINGANKIYINRNKELVIETPLGNIIEQSPIVVQNNAILNSQWKIEGNVISFDISNVNENLPFTIDPLVRIWGTFCGGNGDDIGLFCKTDNSGNVYVTGYTNTTNSGVATSGAHQTIFSGASTFCGNSDAFIIKFNSNGIRQWGTYYGDAGTDEGRCLAIDQNNNIYLTGCAYASSNNTSAIATLGSYKTNCTGMIDAFLAKFNPNGVRVWGTYYGGSGTDESHSCVLDNLGNIYFCGTTDGDSNNSVIVTPNAQQPVSNGDTEGFWAKFDTNGNRLYGTYFGGPGIDFILGCTIDFSNNFILTGCTSSSLNIATIGCHQSTYGGIRDAFVAKYNTNNSLIWSTYYGGMQLEEGYSCTTDALNNIIICGYTESMTNISTSGSDQPFQISGGDAFIVKLNPNGNRIWGTYFGGYSGAIARCCATNTLTGDIFVTGQTSSPSQINHIPTLGCYQDTLGGVDDAFLVRYNSNGIRIWSTYYGGNWEDWGFSVCYDNNNNNIFICGFSDSTSPNSISTPGCHQSLPATVAYDVFLVKFTDSGPTKIETNNKTQIDNYTIYPNPNTGNFTLTIKDKLIGSEISIYNTLGQLVMKATLNSTDNQINLQEFNTGVYYLKFFQNDQEFCHTKIIIN